MPNHATALFGDRHSAHAAVEQLVQAGFPRDAIGVVMSEDAHEREYGDAPPDRSGVRATRHAGILGAIVAGMAALAGHGGIVVRAAGPLVGALSRLGDRGVAAALSGHGMSEEDARFVERGVVAGAIVVDVVTGADRAALATQLMLLSGGEAREAA